MEKIYFKITHCSRDAVEEVLRYANQEKMLACIMCCGGQTPSIILLSTAECQFKMASTFRITNQFKANHSDFKQIEIGANLYYFPNQLCVLFHTKPLGSHKN